MHTNLIDLDSLVVWADNYNRSDVNGIALSIRRFGFNGAPRVWRGVHVRANNHTVLALRLIKTEGARPEIDCMFPPPNVVVDGDTWRIPFIDINHLNENDAIAFAIADNQHARNATQDEVQLLDYLKRFTDDEWMVRAIGFDDESLTRLKILAGDDIRVPVDDDAPPPQSHAEMLQSDWQVEVGDTWQIGKHRLMCDDCRNPSALYDLMDGAEAQGIFTSPPYAEQRAEFYGGIHENSYVEWWGDVQQNAYHALKPGGSFFVNIKPHSRDGERALYVFDLVVAMRRRWHWRFVDEFCWLRHTAPGRWNNRFKNGFEPIYQFQKVGQGKFYPYRVGHASQDVMVSTRRTGGAKSALSTGTYFNVSDETEAGVALPDNVIKVSGVESGIGHSAMFPVGLPEHFIEVFSDTADIWLDPFAGSGTTLIAAERTGRVGYGIELLPENCAIILQRFKDNGFTPVKV